MPADAERVKRASREIASAGVDAVLCQVNAHVVMLSGYAPVLGKSFVLFPVKGDPVLIVPESEADLAREGFISDIHTYPDGGMGQSGEYFSLAGPVIATVATERGLSNATIGYEGSTPMVVASYSQVAFPSHGTLEAYRISLPRAHFLDVSPVLSVMMATKTPPEQRQLQAAAAIARTGFEAARGALQPALREGQVAAAALSAIYSQGFQGGAKRVEAFCHVMSGSRAAEAYKPFNWTADRVICEGDPVLIQMEVYRDGYWCEATRTLFAGDPGAEGRRFYEACLAAQQKALAMIHNGVAAADVDKAARDYLDGDGLGQFFRHGLGHGVGFQAISHLQPPRLEPGSTDTLLTDMTCNIEPSVYIHGWGGVRINDTIVVRIQGYEIITAIPRDLNWAICPVRQSRQAAA